MQDAIPRIDRRLAELDAFEPEKIHERRDPAISSLEHKLSSLLASIYPTYTLEYTRYLFDVTRLDLGSHNVHGTPIHEVRRGLQLGVQTASATLRTIRDGFLEELQDAGQGITSAGRALKAYEGLEIQPDIERAAGQLYRHGHYANAIEDAVKALNAFVRLRSGVDDVDGSALMERVFSPKNPVLKFNPLADQSDLDEQKGFMMMLSGAVAGLRNPRAHRLMKDDPERALEFIAFVSLLAKLVDQAKK
jgi:uncharacterized protein (TIGR02391 family)